MRLNKLKNSKIVNPEFFLVVFVLFSFIGVNPFSIGLDEFNPVEGDASLLRRIIYLGFLAISFYFFIKSKIDISKVVRVYFSYFLFASFLLLSSFWSVESAVTFIRATLFLISLFTLIFFVLSIDIKVFFRKLTILFVALLLLSFISVFILPSAKHAIPELAGNWRGIFSHKNDAGLAMVFSIILFICTYVQVRKKVWLYLALLAFIFLYFTASKTSIGFLFVGLFFGFAYSAFTYSFNFCRMYYWVLFFVIVTLLILYFMSSFEFLIFFESLLFDPTGFTGRSLIWDYLLNLILDKPVLGYGYGAVWGMGDNSSLYDYASNYNIWVFSLTQGHNSYLDVVLAVGIVGLLLFSFVYILNHLAFISDNARLDKYFLFTFYGVWSFFLLHGLMESNFLMVDKGRWTMFHILVLIKARLVFDRGYANK